MKIFEEALKEFGVIEYHGSQHNKRILEYAKEAGFNWVDSDEIPWCSIFANWVCEQVGAERTHLANAKSWLNVGIPVETPEQGDIVVLHRGDKEDWRGHVGFFAYFTEAGKRVTLLGGNQANEVKFSSYPVAKVVGYRRLRHKTDTVSFWKK